MGLRFPIRAPYEVVVLSVCIRIARRKSVPRTTFVPSTVPLLSTSREYLGYKINLPDGSSCKCHRTDGQKKNDSAKQNSESWQSSEKAGLDVEMLRIIDTQIFRGLPCTMRMTYVCESWGWHATKNPRTDSRNLWNSICTEFKTEKAIWFCLPILIVDGSSFL